MKLVTASLIGLLLGTPLLVQDAVSQEPMTQEREHVVRTGDTLWDLAAYYYDDPYQWPAIHRANTGIVANPHLILPEQVLVIPGVAGVAQPAGVPDPMGQAVAQTATTTVARPGPVRTVFYREPPPPRQNGDPTLLSEPGMMILPVKEGEFRSSAYLMNPDRLTVMGHFLRSVRDVEPGRGLRPSSHPEDRVYLEYGGTRPVVGDSLILVAVGRDVDGAARGERIIHPRGIVRIVQLNPDLIEGHLEEQYGPVFPGQLLIPAAAFPEFEVTEAEPLEAGPDLEGKILEFVDEKPLYGPTALALVNVGARHGVQVGDIFEAYLPTRSERVRERGSLISTTEVLPPEVVAELRVVRVTDNYATLMVDDVRLPRLDADLPVRRTRKIP